MYLADVFTISCNLAALPGLSVPCGFTRAGLPIGLQLVGRPFDEATLLRAARALEREHDWHRRRAAWRRRDERGRLPARSSASRCTPSSSPGARSSAAAPPPSARAPNTHVCPVCLGLPGVLPVLNRAGGGVRGARPGWRSAARIQPDERLRAEELLLPGPAQGLPDQPVRAAHLPGRRRRHRRVDGADEARRASPASTWRRTPGRTCTTSAADGSSGVDLNRAGVPLVEIVSEPDLRSADEAVEYLQGAARHPHVPRRQRRQPGGGLVPLRRQRLGDAGGRDRARHARRAEEHQLLPLRAAGHRVRDARGRWSSSRAAGRSCRRRASSTRSAGETRSMRSQGGGARLPLLPRARPAAGAGAGGLGRGGAPRRSPSCPGPGPPATSATSGSPAYDAGAPHRRPGDGRVLRRRARGARRRGARRPSASPTS